MISIASLAHTLENELNNIAKRGNYDFKVWADAGEYIEPRRDGNYVYHTINCQLTPTTTAIDANIIEMGIFGARLEVLVPTNIPRESLSQIDANLAKIQNYQVDFVMNVATVLTSYFAASKLISVMDTGVTFIFAMTGTVAVPENIDLYTSIGEAVSLSVDISLSYVEKGINAFNVKLFIDGERIPYLMFNPSRTSALSTDVQSNDSEQKSVVTSSVYGIQFTAPASTRNFALAAVYDFIADKSEAKTAHFVEIDWDEQRADYYLMFISSANITAQGIDFAGLNVSLAKIYNNAELFSYPSSYSSGNFISDTSADANLTFTLSTTFTVNTYTTPPEQYPFYFYIAGKAYSFPVQLQSYQNNNGIYTATYSGTLNFNTPAEISAEDYIYDESTGNYKVRMVASQAITSVTNVSSPFTWSAEVGNA